MQWKKAAIFLLPAFLAAACLFAACTKRDTGAGMTSTAVVFSTAAHSTGLETSASTTEAGESANAATSILPGTTQPGTEASTTRPIPVTTAPAQSTSTTRAAAAYAEWTYRNKFGNTVTYSENPDNPYIRLVSRQTGISPGRLSASSWSQGAAVFVFRSTDRNADSLDTAYFILAKDMEIFSVTGSDAQAEFSKFSRQTAAALYTMALEHRP